MLAQLVHSHRLSLVLVLTIATPGLVACSETASVGSVLDGSPARRDGGVPGRARADECGNGMDDDGNGRVDDGCPCGPGETQACFQGPTASRRIGACRDGMQVCAIAAGGEWGDWGNFPCAGDTRPAGEMCAGADRDCDGARDEDCPCVDGDSRACGVEFLTAPCTAGVQTCRGSRWSACEGAIAPTPDVCGDGVDNDCDGMRDELCSCVPTPELCRDRVDNDCDGVVDEPACMPDWPGPDGGVIPDFDAGVPVGGCTCTQGADQAFGTIALEDTIPMTASVMHGNFAAARHLRDDDQLGMILTQSTGTGMDAAQLVVLDYDGVMRSGPITSPWPGSERGIATEADGLVPTPSGYLVAAGGAPASGEPLSWRRTARDMTTVAPFDPDTYATPGAIGDPVHPGPRVRTIRFIATPGATLAVWLECRAWTTHMSGFFSTSECTEPALMQQRVNADLVPTTPAERLDPSGTTGLVMLTRVFWSGTHLVVAGRQNVWPAEQRVGVSLVTFAGTTLAHRHDGVTQPGDALTTSDLAVVGDRMLHCYSMYGGGSLRPLFCQLLGLDGSAVAPPVSAGAIWGDVKVANAGCAFIVVTNRVVSPSPYGTMPTWFPVDAITGTPGADADLYPRESVLGNALALFPYGAGARILTVQPVRLATPPRPPEDPYTYFLQRRTLTSRDIACVPPT